MKIEGFSARHARRWNVAQYEHREVELSAVAHLEPGESPEVAAANLLLFLRSAVEGAPCVISAPASAAAPVSSAPAPAAETPAPVSSNSPSPEEADPFSAEAPEPTPEPAKRRGRPRKDASASPPAEPAVSAAPPSAAAGEADPFASEPTPAPEPAKPAAAKVISDKELLQAAQKLASQPEGFARVKALAEMFGAKSVVALAQEHRAAFLEQLGA